MTQFKSTVTSKKIIVCHTILFFHESIVDARVLEVSDDPKTGEKQYYVHFLNFEKRMDKWVPQSLVKKNFGKISTAIEGVHINI